MLLHLMRSPNAFLSVVNLQIAYQFIAVEIAEEERWRYRLMADKFGYVTTWKQLCYQREAIVIMAPLHGGSFTRY